MKIITKMMMLWVILFSSYTTMAQVITSDRQNYFSKYSQKLPASESELEKAFHVPEGGKVKINFADFSFNGIVVTSIRRYENLYSVLVKAPGLDNSILAISKTINPDQSVSYIGRIINQNYADGFELRKETNGNYAMNKIRTEAMIEDY